MIQQVNRTPTRKIKSARSHAERLAIYQRGKDFRNQMLKDKGSWSYDWRISLNDLERNHDPHSSQIEVSCATPEPPRSTAAPRNVRADQIPPPAVWTVSSFYSFVVRLATSKVDRLISRKIYSKGEVHVSAVADILANLFADPTLKFVVSTEAGNRALQFLFDNGKFARGRGLFGQLQELQKDKDPATYNIMLGAAAKQKDLHSFTYILKTMITYGVRPDNKTWFSLAQVVREDEVRMVIIGRMAKLGLLSDLATMKEAVALLMPQWVLKWLDSGKDPQGLLEAMDHQYGAQWCSERAAESMINEFGVRRSIREALIIQDKLYDRGYQPTRGILLLLLRQCAWSKAHELMVEILGFFRIKYKVKPSKQVYDSLFKQVWKSGLYNCSRVLWIYTCIQGHTTFDMQEKVRKSLYAARCTSVAGQSRSKAWEESAGKVITGHGPRNNTARFHAMMSLWNLREPSRQARDGFLRAVRRILDGDLGAVGQYHISKPLDELLSEALRADRRWALARALKDVPIECKHSQVIDVPLVAKSPLQTSDVPEESSADWTVDNAVASALSDEKGRAVPSGRCWMSPETRVRPCTCPAYVKQGLGASSNTTMVDGHQEQDQQAGAASSATA
ncbi:MAG: hypothetical protein Q9182_005956 [Xanthomendoza sp. 2 TL-2023]